MVFHFLDCRLYVEICIHFYFKFMVLFIIGFKANNRFVKLLWILEINDFLNFLWSLLFKFVFIQKFGASRLSIKIKFVSIQLMIKYLARNHFEHFLEMWQWKLKYTFLLKFQVVDIFDFEDLFSKIEILTGEHSLPGHILALVLLFITKKDYKLLKAS